MGLSSSAIQGARLIGVWDLRAGATQQILATVTTRTSTDAQENQSAPLLLHVEPYIGRFSVDHTL